MDDKYLWHIHGKRHDLRSFVHKHPAGPAMLLMGQGRDCTELFESYHALTDKPSAMLKSFEVRHNEKPFEESPFHWETTPFFDTLKKRVRSHFATTGRSHKASRWMWGRIIASLTTLSIIVYYWLLGHWWTLVPLALVYWTFGPLFKERLRSKGTNRSVETFHRDILKQL